MVQLTAVFAVLTVDVRQQQVLFSPEHSRVSRF